MWEQGNQKKSSQDRWQHDLSLRGKELEQNDWAQTLSTANAKTKKTPGNNKTGVTEF